MSKSLILTIENKNPVSLFDGIISGNRYSLSKALTLVESTNSNDQKIADDLVSKCLPHAGKSMRIAISGSPGVGKSTIIESLGLHIVEKGYRPAILAIDPSSDISQGSILGDKTRMERLSKTEKAFIRPSPTSGTLGGVTQKTFEAIILCEAAGYDTIFIETVGVGQSETFAKKLSDLFILLVAPGGGDELQGIKRGIVELADIIVVNKSEENRKALSDASLKAYKNATHMAQVKDSNWPISILACSALNSIGIDKLWEQVLAYQVLTQKNGYQQHQRKQQKIYWAKNAMRNGFNSILNSNQAIKKVFDNVISDIANDQLSPEKAANSFLSKLKIGVKK